MNNTQNCRIDEVSKYYKPATRADTIATCLFWISSIISLCIPYTKIIPFFDTNILRSGFIVLVIVYFVISQISRFYLVPIAERMRRKQMLSDAFGAPLSHDKTSLYYNNTYSPSLHRLGANSMENSLFSKEIASKMLIKKRFLIASYAILWLTAFSLRHNNLDIITWITQILFSGEILAKWLNLEILRIRHERTYDQLHSHFMHEVGADTPKAIATVLDAFVSYESAKSSAGLLLSSKAFKELNPSLTAKWEEIRRDLKMDSLPDV